MHYIQKHDIPLFFLFLFFSFFFLILNWSKPIKEVQNEKTDKIFNCLVI